MLCQIYDCTFNRPGTLDQQTAVLGYLNFNFYSALGYQMYSSYLKVFHAEVEITAFLLPSTLLSC